jgi:hypothetical protein
MIQQRDNVPTRQEARLWPDAIRVGVPDTLSYDAMFGDACRRTSAAVLCQNCVTYPQKTRGNTAIYGDTQKQIVVAGKSAEIRRQPIAVARQNLVG